ncbi:DUF2264 domain-containing protein [Arcicella sp. DC2W]|uniref:DUF2264 domain-containing protein n=1 Tax=Arcicella gelida TaxID=2984195 RepID=A0ABU5S7G5_9BACT|nr:DUF2264 domain-containing protein [Arcicella sp. DC2W]MEA5404355.1 DUF2264 domain-containing protein [Arcicella sp. DC2W]
MFKKILLVCVFALPLGTLAQQKPINDRAIWLQHLDQLAKPILRSLANDSLRIVMPQTMSKFIDNANNRKEVAYLEAFGRLMCGISPWLNLEGGSAKEVTLRNLYRNYALKAVANAVNPNAKDYMAFERGGQPLVDASFLALAFVRCPWLWEHLDTQTKDQVVKAFLATRNTKAGFSNWILFSGMIETFFCKYGYPWDNMRIEYCFRQFEQWYVGDGVYSDGPPYHWDYYNSYVIHPYLANMVKELGPKTGLYNWTFDKIKQRNERFAVIQERLINSDGSFPATGRSIVYRGAAFHHLADIAWRKGLPKELSPAQVRGALTAVIKKTTESTSTFTKDGWLTIGLYGSQPDLADFYITTGSLYLCANILLPLGLPETDEFWSSPATKWTSQKVWSGEAVLADHAIE